MKAICFLLFAIAGVFADEPKNQAAKDYLRSALLMCRIQSGKEGNSAPYYRCFKDTNIKYPRTYNNTAAFNACRLPSELNPKRSLCDIFNDPERSVPFTNCVYDEIQKQTGEADKEMEYWAKHVFECYPLPSQYKN